MSPRPRFTATGTARCSVVAGETLIEKRFDRTDDGHKLAMEDFCQLQGLLLADVYGGSAELCAQVVQR